MFVRQNTKRFKLCPKWYCIWPRNGPGESPLSKVATKKDEDRRVSNFECGNQHYTKDMKRCFQAIFMYLRYLRSNKKGMPQGVSNQIFIEMVNIFHLLDFKPRLNQISRFCQEEKTNSFKKANNAAFSPTTSPRPG